MMGDGTERLGDDDGPELPDLPDLDGTGGPDDVEEVAPAAPETGTARRRLAGLLATVLALVGIVASVVLAFLALRVLFTASGIVDDRFEPVETSFDRLEERIDETDDLVSRDGVPAERVAELRARVDGLVDIADLTARAFQTIDGHPLYRLLPADLAPLGESLDGFQTSAEQVDTALGSGTSVGSSAAARMATEVDGMQSRVTDARERLDAAAGSLRSWLRIGGLLGFLIALWSLWAQRSLLRRGWRGFRNQPL